MGANNGYIRFSKLFLRISLAVLFLYFGFLAVFRPETQEIWIRKEFLNLIPDFLGARIFLLIFGFFQILSAFSILLNLYIKWGLWLAALILIPIIINLLNFSAPLANDIALRDIVILASVIYLALNENNPVRK